MTDQLLSLCYSVPASLGMGGMGRGMLASVRAAAEAGWKVRAITAPGGQHLPGVEAAEVDVSWVPRLARLTPARFSPAWLRYLHEAAHDRRAVGLVGRSDVFQGAGHCCLASLREAKRAGALTIVESMTAHARHLDRLMRCEERSAGSSAHFHNRRTVARCEAEYAEADFIYCNSSYTRRTLVEEGVPAEKVLAVPLGVELPEEVARHEEAQRFRVLFVGQLALWKGFRYLLAAWEKLSLPGAELYLRGGTGDRPCRRILEDYRRRIEVTVDGAYGPIPYHQFSVLVLPSISDGFGLVVPEAMAAGLPVIVTENVGAADCVREGVDGYVVPAADQEALAGALETLHADRDRLIAMGRAARERAAEFSMAAFAKAYTAEIRRVAGR